ncbi:cytochrome c biogenesis protein CcsA [Thermomicrobium sp. 4228-Ro]|uniref:cytochrome c biogenesis protein CcsA n=1 Tax=Thermomicrobium sp. 4228-Ro TaxID=2993937 RepID=UPI0022489381|nr:cytochrome c biogenesis protein CcsA [Thermomicrobium sp. 4228-Ro]MCX2727513.1 cytochrome c biogenesis protein CcsA [Thermomicrobium sp. 4228-Ro]
MSEQPRASLWLTILGTASFALIALSVAMIFLYAPADATQGGVQRLFYLHLPAAWLAYVSFFIIFVSSIAFLLRGTVGWDRLARSAAELGFIFTTLVLLTGSIWGRPIWGTWWTWDARLTTTLILWFIYLGYFLLRAYIADPERGARYAAVLGIVGFVDIPIIHMSVRWWRTLHPQPIVVRSEGPAMPTEMLLTMLVTLVAFCVLYAFLLIVKYRIETVRDELLALRAATMN